MVGDNQKWTIPLQYSGLLPHHFVAGAEPLVEGFIDLGVDFGGDFALYLFVDIEHGGPFVEYPDELEHGTGDEAYRRNGVDDGGIDENAVEGRGLLVLHHVVELEQRASRHTAYLEGIGLQLDVYAVYLVAPIDIFYSGQKPFDIFTHNHIG